MRTLTGIPRPRRRTGPTPGPCDVTAVSYTHLDVYKRQQQHRVGVIDALGRRVDENVERAGHFQLTLTRVDNSWKVAKWLNVQP